MGGDPGAPAAGPSQDPLPIRSTARNDRRDLGVQGHQQLVEGLDRRRSQHPARDLAQRTPLRPDELELLVESTVPYRREVVDVYREVDEEIERHARRPRGLANCPFRQ